MTGNSPLVDFRRPSEYGPPRVHLAAVGLYASTPAYREVFGLYDLGDLADRLRLMSRAGQWDAMGELIDDDLLAEFSVEAPPQAVVAEIRRRYDGVLDRALIYQPYPSPPGLWGKFKIF